MLAVNRIVCDLLIKKNKFKPIYCQLCKEPNNKGQCKNWQRVMEAKDRQYEDKVLKFDETRKMSKCDMSA